MGNVLAIDPGDVESGFALIDAATCKPLEFGILPNEDLLQRLTDGEFDYDRAAIEMIASYGMPVGAEVFETCVWIGRFYEAIGRATGIEAERIKRLVVKLHHCHDSKAKDTNITRALVDRFAPGASNFGKGTKADPGWFYGFAKHVWPAYGLAVVVADLTENRAVA